MNESTLNKDGLRRLWAGIKEYINNNAGDYLTDSEEQTLLAQIGQVGLAFSDLTEGEQSVLLSKLEEIK